MQGWTDHVQLLEMLARKSGRLIPGGEPDIDGVAKVVLHDFMGGCRFAKKQMKMRATNRVYLRTLIRYKIYYKGCGEVSQRRQMPAPLIRF